MTRVSLFLKACSPLLILKKYKKYLKMNKTEQMSIYKPKNERNTICKQNF